MKKTILFLLVPFVLFSQQKNIKINYSVFATGGSLEKNKDVLESVVAASFIGVDQEIKKLDYELLVNNKSAYFHLISILDLNVKASRLARSFAGNAVYHTNLEKKEVVKIVEFMGEKFNVLLDTNRVWLLHNETKIINDYLCYKATCTKTLKLKKTNNALNIIAWYCPSMPFNYGPKDYWGLPGLILELEEDKITYVASKILIDDKLNISLKPFEGKIINEEEFYEIVEETHKKTLNTLHKD